MRRFWIDTDPGTDDVVAIMMALRWPDVHVEGISVVAGNTPVHLGSRNARYTVELCGKETPVYTGLARPLLRQSAWAESFHGADGLGGVGCPEPKRPPAKGHAVEALIKAANAAPGQINLVTLGPLSNIAMALSLDPTLADKIAQCYVMGGTAATVGNITPAAEFNIWTDPEAARIVFHSGLRILMVGWELCRGAANLSDDDIAHVRSFHTPYGDFAMDINLCGLKSNREILGDPGMPLPDAVAMAVALDGSVCTKRDRHYVDVETQSELTRGMTVVDQLHVVKKEPNIQVCWAIDVPKWKATLYRALQ